MKIKSSMLADYYEFTMAQSYLEAGVQNTEAVFDVFFRKNPFQKGYGVMGGVDQIIELIKNFKFDADDIAYFRSKKIF